MDVLAVGIAGIVGAWCRYLISLAANPVGAAEFPWGTLACNLAGCLFLGYLGRAAFLKWSPRLQLAINTGFIGSFTTFSTFSVETVELFRGGEIGMAIAYVLLSLWGGLGLAWDGFALAKRKEGMKRDA